MLGVLELGRSLPEEAFDLREIGGVDAASATAKARDGGGRPIQVVCKLGLRPCALARIAEAGVDPVLERFVVGTPFPASAVTVALLLAPALAHRPLASFLDFSLAIC